MTEDPRVPARLDPEVHAAPVAQPATAAARFTWRSPRALLCLGIALAADGLQLGLLPLFAPGGAAPWDAGVDVLVGGLMVWLLGWHIAFAPAFVNELIPFLDLFPTWTAAVIFVVARKSRHKGVQA